MFSNVCAYRPASAFLQPGCCELSPIFGTPSLEKMFLLPGFSALIYPTSLGTCLLFGTWQKFSFYLCPRSVWSFMNTYLFPSCLFIGHLKLKSFGRLSVGAGRVAMAFLPCRWQCSCLDWDVTDLIQQHCGTTGETPDTTSCAVLRLHIWARTGCTP